MACKIRVFTLVLGCFAFSSLLVNAASTRRLDGSWKRYYNRQWGYCVSYPSRWLKADAYEGAGIVVESGVKKQSLPMGEIDVGVLPAAHVNPTLTPAMSLADDLEVHLRGLKKFVRAERIEVLEQRPTDLVGNSALFSKERYYDPLERATWVGEVIFARRDSNLFRLELECRADQVDRFEPIFTRLVGSFQFDCSERK